MGCLAVNACGIEELDTPLPYIRVDVPFSLISYWKLSTPPSAIKLKEREQGYNLNGLILVRVSDDTFRAYDATCTRNIKEENASVVVADDMFTAHCPKCGAVYTLLTGAYEKNGKYRLQDYRATYNKDSQRGHITN